MRAKNVAGYGAASPMQASDPPPLGCATCGPPRSPVIPDSHAAIASQSDGCGPPAPLVGAQRAPVDRRAAAPRLLDKGDETHPPERRRVRLSKAQLRARDQIECRLATWHRQGYRAFFLTLTSSPESPIGTINLHFQYLRHRIAKYLGIARSALEYVRVTTREGHGVIHSVVGVPADSLPRPTILIPFELLQNWWTELHGAFMVNVKRIGGGQVDRKRVSTYIVAQYLANQEGAYLRLSQSRCAIDWRAIRAQLREQAWPHRWDVVERRNKLGPGLPDIRIRAWKVWSWRRWRLALRDLLAHGVTTLWGRAYWLKNDTLRVLLLSEREKVLPAA